MMTEQCKHNYSFGISLSSMVERLSDPACVKCDYCDSVLGEAEILSALNEYETLKAATERLSALDAAFIYARLAFAGDVPHNILDAIRAYANILEGK